MAQFVVVSRCLMMKRGIEKRVATKRSGEICQRNHRQRVNFIGTIIDGF